jgi:hypothetical protein
MLPVVWFANDSCCNCNITQTTVCLSALEQQAWQPRPIKRLTLFFCQWIIFDIGCQSNDCLQPIETIRSGYDIRTGVEKRAANNALVSIRPVGAVTCQPLTCGSKGPHKRLISPLSLESPTGFAANLWATSMSYLGFMKLGGGRVITDGLPVSHEVSADAD